MRRLLDTLYQEIGIEDDDEDGDDFDADDDDAYHF